MAVIYGEINLVKLLVDSGADVDYVEPSKDICESALRLATLNQKWEIVEYLILVSKNQQDKRYAKQKLSKAKGSSK